MIQVASTNVPRILLVEDNPADVRLVREALRSHGISPQLMVISDGEEALRHLLGLNNVDSGELPDLLLLDINLPRRSGLEVLREFRSQRPEITLPVIIVTSSVLPDDRGEAADLGVHDYFRKPSRLDEFMELGGVVRKVIDSFPQAPGTLN